MAVQLITSLLQVASSVSFRPSTSPLPRECSREALPFLRQFGRTGGIRARVRWCGKTGCKLAGYPDPRGRTATGIGHAAEQRTRPASRAPRAALAGASADHRQALPYYHMDIPLNIEFSSSNSVGDSHYLLEMLFRSES